MVYLNKWTLFWVCLGEDFLNFGFLLKKVVFNYFFFCNFVAIMIIKFYCYEKS